MLQKNWMDLIKPSKMDVNVQENDGRRGILIAEPLERGFGLTLGNSIRRILLSSFSFKIFSTSSSVFAFSYIKLYILSYLSAAAKIDLTIFW